MREAQRVHTGSEGAGGPRAHDVAKIAGRDGERDHQRRVRVSYDAVTDAYVERVHGELVHKPLDRALLDGLRRAGAGWVRCRRVGLRRGMRSGPRRRVPCRQGLTVTGIDLSPAMIVRARELHPNVTFEVGTMTALEAGDGALAGLDRLLFAHPPDQRRGAPRRLA